MSVSFHTKNVFIENDLLEQTAGTHDSPHRNEREPSGGVIYPFPRNDHAIAAIKQEVDREKNLFHT